MNYILIDPPVSPFSSTEELHDWLMQLKAMDDTQEVRDAIKTVEAWIEQAAEGHMTRQR